MEIQKTFVPDVDADDAKASGMLGMISRVEADESDRMKSPSRFCVQAAVPARFFWSPSISDRSANGGF